MTSEEKYNDQITEIFSNIKDCLSSKDNTSIEEGLRLLCGMMSRGYNLSDFSPLIARHLINDVDENEILAQMLFAQLGTSDVDTLLTAVNTLNIGIGSPNEVKRARAVKTLTTIASRAMPDFVGDLIRVTSEDPSPLVRKAALLGSAKLVEANESKRNLVKGIIKSALRATDPTVVSAAIFTAEAINEQSLLVQNAELIWNRIQQLDPSAQSTALHHLRSVPNKQVVASLLHSQNYSVVIEAVIYFEDEPSTIVMPLLALLFSDPITSVHALTVLERIAAKDPNEIISFVTYFFPPQSSPQAEHLCVQILGHAGNIIPPVGLFRWALRGNALAAHFLGKLEETKFLQQLLREGSQEIAEISASYLTAVLTKQENRILVISLAQMRPFNAPFVSIYTDICRDYQDISLQVLSELGENYSHLGRDVKSEAAFLAARLADLEGSSLANDFIQKCLTDPNPDIVQRMKQLLDLMNSDKAEVKEALWMNQDPILPAPPVLYFPKIG